MQYKASDAYRAKISLLTPSIPSHTVGSMASEQQHKGSMDEAMLEQPLIQPAPMDHDGARPWLLTIVGFMFLTFSSALALSSCNRGYGAVAFVVFSYLDLVMLFYCLRLYERTPPESLHRRELLKMVMWVLTTMHTIAVFKLLEFWFLSTENSIKNFQDDTPMSSSAYAYPPAVP
ncbi:unnamed protein product [Urochloa decumbens]|uniref:Uncharacterized protein n=1 Tax=Urochloa decumbens TaxID=240449 RepID=A0ABC8VED1_9POAL